MSDSHGLARPTDPATSHDAAPTRSRRLVTRDLVHAVLLDGGPGTHEEIVARYHERESMAGWVRATDQRIRTAVSELVRLGYVVADEHTFGRSSTGRRAQIWRVVAVDWYSTRTNQQATA